MWRRTRGGEEEESSRKRGKGGRKKIRGRGAGRRWRSKNGRGGGRKVGGEVEEKGEEEIRRGRR